MFSRKLFDRSRIIERVNPPRIKEICFNEELYEGALYLIYKFKDNIYPDVGNITTKFYGKNKPRIERLWAVESLNSLDRFIQSNHNDRDTVAILIEELSMLPEIKVNELVKEIEDIFERYKNILRPTCELYKMCYYWASVCRAADIRIYKGRPTIIKRSFTVYGSIGYILGKFTKGQALDIWSEKFANNLSGEWIKEFKCIPVREHFKELSDERFIHKKGEKIHVHHHLRLIKELEKFSKEKKDEEKEKENE